MTVLAMVEISVFAIAEAGVAGHAHVWQVVDVIAAV